MNIDHRIDADSELLKAVKHFQNELLENRAPAKLLSTLADIYHSHTSQSKSATPSERLRTSLGGDEVLMEAVIAALKQTPRRTDLPSAEQVIDLAGTGRTFAITAPYLIGLSMNDLPVWSDENEMRRALALRLCAFSSSGGGKDPLWYAHLLNKRPELVASMFEVVAARFFRSELMDFSRLYDLSRDDHSEVAHALIKPLLRKFPLRGVRGEKLHVLISLLQIALRQTSKDELIQLVEYKISCKSLAANQRVYWTCFGLALDGPAFDERLCGLFANAGRQRLLPHLVDFLFGFQTSASHRLHVLMDIGAIKTVLRLLGPGIRPSSFRGAETAFEGEAKDSIIVNSLIHRLAQNPSPEARKALTELAEDDSLLQFRERFRLEEDRTLARIHVRELPHVIIPHSTIEPDAPMPRALSDAGKVNKLMQQLGECARGDGCIYLVGGASAVIIGWRDSTIDVDLKLDPEPDGVFEAIAQAKDALDMNIELAAPDDFIPPLPGWKDRSQFIAKIGHVEFRHYDFYAQALAKVERGHRIDLLDAQAMTERGLVEPSKLMTFYETIQSDLLRYPAIDPATFRAQIEKFAHSV